MLRCFGDPLLSRFDTIPACNRQTDRQTHNDRKYGANMASHGKKRMLIRPTIISNDCVDLGCVFEKPLLFEDGRSRR